MQIYRYDSCLQNYLKILSYTKCEGFEGMMSQLPQIVYNSNNLLKCILIINSLVVETYFCLTRGQWFKFGG